MTIMTTEDSLPGDVWEKPGNSDSRLIVVEKFSEWSLVMRFSDERRGGVWPLRVLASCGYERVRRGGDVEVVRTVEDLGEEAIAYADSHNVSERERQLADYAKSLRDGIREALRHLHGGVSEHASYCGAVEVGSLVMGTRLETP